MIVDLYDATRVFRHDYKNMLTVMDGYCRARDYDGAAAYLGALREEFAETLSLENVPDIAKIQDNGLKWLVFSKYIDAHTKRIDFLAAVSPDVSLSRARGGDMHAVIGILLDNAIEAAAEAADDRTVRFEMANRGGDTFISVRNSFGNPPDVRRIFEKNYSSKRGHSGLGLYRARAVLRKYDNILLSAEADDIFFRIDINITGGVPTIR
jgi:two-component system sensor histidine kinase AgrC